MHQTPGRSQMGLLCQDRLFVTHFSTKPMLSRVNQTATSCRSSLGNAFQIPWFHSFTFSKDTVALSSTIWGREVPS